MSSTPFCNRLGCLRDSKLRAAPKANGSRYLRFKPVLPNKVSKPALVSGAEDDGDGKAGCATTAAYLDVGFAEVFGEGAVSYANGPWTAGVQAALLV